jgi:hypothetical protein
MPYVESATYLVHRNFELEVTEPSGRGLRATPASEDRSSTPTARPQGAMALSRNPVGVEAA